MTKLFIQPEVILEVGGEGGGYTILGVQNDGHWRFWREPDCGDSWMYDDEENDVESSATLSEQPKPEQSISCFGTLAEVLEQINSCWPHLLPTQVHPDFVKDIWQRAVNFWRENDGHRTEYVLPRWSVICLGREITSFADLLKE